MKYLLLITLLVFSACYKPIQVKETDITSNKNTIQALPTSCGENTLLYGKLQPIKTAKGKLYGYYIIENGTQNYLGNIKKEVLLGKQVFAIAKTKNIEFQRIGENNSNAFIKDAKVSLIETDDGKNLKNIRKICGEF